MPSSDVAMYHPKEMKILFLFLSCFFTGILAQDHVNYYYTVYDDLEYEQDDVIVAECQDDSWHLSNGKCLL